MTFLYLMNNIKPLSQELITAHVEHLKTLNAQGQLIFCGPFADYPGGMVLFTSKDLEQATNIAKSDPFISSGCKSFEIRTVEPANSNNNYLLPTP